MIQMRGVLIILSVSIFAISCNSTAPAARRKRAAEGLGWECKWERDLIIQRKAGQKTFVAHGRIQDQAKCLALVEQEMPDAIAIFYKNDEFGTECEAFNDDYEKKKTHLEGHHVCEKKFAEPAEPECKFMLAAGIQTLGGTAMPDLTTLEECMEECLYTEECTALDWNKSHDGCYVHMGPVTDTKENELIDQHIKYCPPK